MTTESADRTSTDLEQGFVLGEWLVQPRLNLISSAHARHRVQTKFMEVLVCLAERGDMVTRHELFDQVWHETLVVEECLTRAVSELRKVLGDHPRHPRFIETIPKKGYRLLVPAVPAEPGQLDGPCPEADARGAQRPRPWARRLVMSAPAAALVVAVAILGQLGGAAGRTSTEPAEVVQLTCLPGRESFPALSPSGDRLAFVWDGGEPEAQPGLFVSEVGSIRPRRLAEQEGRYAWPAWSHDGRRVVFVRIEERRTDILAVAADGGAEELLVSGADGTFPLMPDLSPDGRWLAFSALVDGSLGVFLKHLGSGEVRRLTDPGPRPAADVRPRFGPDGRRLAFLRSRPSGFALGVVPVAGGEPVHLEVGDRSLIDLAWDPEDDGSLVFTASDGIWRVPTSGGEPRLLAPSAGSCRRLATARETGLLAWVEAREERDIWQCALGPEGRAEAPRRLIASSRFDGLPAWSHDGLSIAFLSDRTGELQLWLADADGANPRRLTAGSPAFPQPPAWSPDDGSIAWVAVREGQAKVCTVSVRDGAVRVLSDPGPHELAPSWSVDGRWVYVSRQVGAEWYIARRPAAGGPVEAVGTEAGFGAMEAPWDDEVIFTRVSGDAAELWRTSIAGGPAQPCLVPTTGRLVSWTVRGEGIYCLLQDAERVDQFRLGLRPRGGGEELTLLETTSRSVFTFDVGPGGGGLVFDRAERSESDIIGLRRG